jgi:hypothetical protein
MRIKNKKGLIFLLDVLIAFAIIVVGVISTFSYFYTNPQSNQIDFYSYDLSNFIITTTFSQLDNSFVRGLLANDTIREDFKIAEEFAFLCNTSTPADKQLFTDIMNSTVRGIIPDYRSYSVIVYNGSCLVETECLNYINFNGNPVNSSFISSTRSFIFGINNSEVIGPYCLEVKVW